MNLIEIDEEQKMSREEAAKLLHQIADSLSRHNEVAFVRGGIQHRVDVRDDVVVEIELEVGDEESSLEVEITW